MELIARIVEGTLVVSVATHALLFVIAVIFRDGPVWATWRMNVFFGGLSAVGVLLALHYTQTIGTQADQGAVVAFAVIAVARLGGSVTNILLAIHLHRVLFLKRDG